MSGPEREGEAREVVREVLRELVPGMLAQVPAPAADGHANPSGDASGSGHGNGNGNGNGRLVARGHPRPDGGDHSRADRTNGSGSGSGEAVIPQVPAPPVAAVLRPSTWARPLAPGEVIGSSPSGPAAEVSTRSQPSMSATAPDPRAQRLRAAFRESEFRPAPGVPAGRAGDTDSQPDVPNASPAAATRVEETRIEMVAVASNEDLEQFVRQLMVRLDNPRERLAIRTGRLRFSLRPSAVTASAGAAAASPATMRVERGAVTERMIRTAAAEGTRLVLAPAAVLTPLAREEAKARGVEIERERRC